MTRKSNLKALHQVDPLLAERLSRECLEEHCRIGANGPQYVYHRSTYSLHLSEAQLAALCQDIDWTQPVLIFGAGGGDLVRHCLERTKGAPVTVWDRDPAVLRFLLAQLDLVFPIRRQQLQLRLGVDLLKLLPRHEEFQCIVDPVLGDIYNEEQLLWASGTTGRHVVTRAGGLLIDDIGDTLRRFGFSVIPADLVRWPLEEIQYTLQQSAPEVIVAVNYLEGLEKLSDLANCPVVCWEMDPTLSQVSAPLHPTEDTHIFACRPVIERAFQAQGFSSVHYLPLATNPHRRRPMDLSEEERLRYRAPVSFVGASLVNDAIRCQEEFIRRYVAWRRTPQAESEARAGMRSVLSEQAKSPENYRVPTLMQDIFGSFVAQSIQADTRIDPTRLVGEIAAMERRLNMMVALAPLSPRVWGDRGWKQIVRHGVRHTGTAASGDELTRVYNATEINIDIGRIYQKDIPPMRVFDVLACGRFLIAEHNERLCELLKVGVEVETWSTPEELREKCAYYLAHPDRAAAIAQRGMEAVRKSHTIQGRLSRMFKTAGVPVDAG
jgi:spore maturation protein CgeB